MKNIFGRTAAFVIAAALSAAVVSCSSSDSSSEGSNLVGSPGGDVNIKEEDMPYGATFTMVMPESCGVTIEYDYRYLTEEEAQTVDEYFMSLVKNDLEMYERVVYPGFLDYMVDAAQLSSAQDYLSMEYETLKIFTGDEFEFTYFIINELRDADDYDFSRYDEIIHNADPDAQISDKKVVYTECIYKYLTENGGGGSLTYDTGGDAPLCVYTIDGEIYILPM